MVQKELLGILTPKAHGLGDLVELIVAHFFELLAFSSELLVDLDRLFRHHLVGFLRATGEDEIGAGGSQETHEVMTEKAIKINEKLAAKGKQLEEVSHDEFDEIAQSVGFRRQDPK